jgi:hypothetical protein
MILFCLQLSPRQEIFPQENDEREGKGSKENAGMHCQSCREQDFRNLEKTIQREGRLRIFGWNSAYDNAPIFGGVIRLSWALSFNHNWKEKI